MHTENLIVPSIPLKNVLYLWEENDILVFVIDQDHFDTFGTEHISNTEKEDLEKLQTLYFKKRFIVSRTVLKYILCCLFKLESTLDIITYKDEFGEVRIFDHEELHVCISYSENIITLAISKVKVGIDVEIKRTLALRNTSKYFQTTLLHVSEPVTDIDLLKLWTLKEAYCKFSNKGMLSLLYKEPDFSDASYSNYTLNDKYIFSVVTDSSSHTITISCLENINSN